MITLFSAVITQLLTFMPLALAIYISFVVLNATDMTLDSSFVVGAAVFARLISLQVSPILAAISAILAGAIAGIGVAIIQSKQKIDSLLAGVLATFILASGNLLIMGKPNISLLTKTTLVSQSFSQSEFFGWITVACYSGFFCLLACLLLQSRIGLILRGFGDNPALLQRLGKNIENYRLLGFAVTNGLAAVAGCFTAQTVGYADIGMGFGVTLTALGTVILGKQIISRQKFFVMSEFAACFLGVVLYFFTMNLLLRLSINPIYLKMLLGIALVMFLRAAKFNLRRA